MNYMKLRVMVLMVLLSAGTRLFAQGTGTTYSAGDYVPTKSTTGKWGYKQFGEWVVEPRFDKAGDFVDGLASVSLYNKYGYINRSGESAIPFKYEQAGPFSEGLARVRLYNKWGFIDKTGTLVIPFKFSDASDFSNGLAKVSVGDENGFVDKTGEWFDTAEEMMQSFSAFARHYVETDINKWQLKGKYEKISEWKARVTDSKRKKRIDSLLVSASSAFIASESKKVQQNFSVVDYDTENEVFLVHDTRFGNLLVPVPIREAQRFEDEFKNVRREDVYCINGDNLGLKEAKFITPYGRTYKFKNTASLSFTSIDIDYSFEPVSFDDNPKSSPKNNQQIAYQNVKVGQSDVDMNIPDTHDKNDNTFALIISNENYKFVSNVPFASNDGRVFEQYCIKTLGLPKDHVHWANDATYGMIMGEMDWIANIAKVYKGNAKLLVYYAGHGIPDESTRDSFLLPVDGTEKNTNTAIKLSSIYSKLNEYPTQSAVVFLDACFSGAQRDGQMLSQARGVAINPKKIAPSGNLVVFSASQGDETAYAYTEKGHGLFSYYLLKKLQESKGNTTLGELAAFVAENVSKDSAVKNSKNQTPTVVSSAEMKGIWMNLKLK